MEENDALGPRSSDSAIRPRDTDCEPAKTCARTNLESKSGIETNRVRGASFYITRIESFDNQARPIFNIFKILHVICKVV